MEIGSDGEVHLCGDLTRGNHAMAGRAASVDLGHADIEASSIELVEQAVTL